MTVLTTSLTPRGKRRHLGAAWGLLVWLTALPAAGYAHGTQAGKLQLDHPYAVPSVPGESFGKAYLRGIQNTGKQAERLVSASTPVAARVALHRLRPDAHGLRSTPVDAIDLPPKTTTLLRHTGDYQLTLLDLTQPLKDGDRFDVTLYFQHAGRQTISVWVQTPREPPASHAAH